MVTIVVIICLFTCPCLVAMQQGHDGLIRDTNGKATRQGSKRRSRQPSQIVMDKVDNVVIQD